MSTVHVYVQYIYIYIYIYLFIFSLFYILYILESYIHHVSKPPWMVETLWILGCLPPSNGVRILQPSTVAFVSCPGQAPSLLLRAFHACALRSLWHAACCLGLFSCSSYGVRHLACRRVRRISCFLRYRATAMCASDDSAPPRAWDSLARASRPDWPAAPRVSWQFLRVSVVSRRRPPFCANRLFEPPFGTVFCFCTMTECMHDRCSAKNIR